VGTRILDKAEANGILADYGRPCDKTIERTPAPRPATSEPPAPDDAIGAQLADQQAHASTPGRDHELSDALLLMPALRDTRGAPSIGPVGRTRFRLPIPFPTDRAREGRRR
jgi:hypothetical protein